MDIIQKILGYAKLKPTEEKNFRLLFLQTLLFGFATSFYLVVVNSYFIKKASTASLPAGYILSGLLGFLLTGLYKRMIRTGGPVKGYAAVLISFCVLCVVLFIGRCIFPDSSPVSRYIAYLGFMGVSPFFAIIFLGFAKITLKVYNIAESKRLLALVGTGEVFASFVAYLSVPFLTRVLGSAVPLLLFSAVFSFLALISLKYISDYNREKLADFSEDKNVKKIDLKLFLKNRFYFLFAVVTVFSVLAVYLVDFSFLLSVKFVAKEEAVDTASVVAVVFCIIKFGELVFSLLSRSIMSNQGMKFALLLQPAVLLACVVLASFFGAISMEFSFFVIAFLLFNKWAIRVLSKALTAPAMKVLYLVTDPQDRAQLQTNVDGTLNQYATILSGCILLVISTCFGKMNVISFLVIVSIICILAFATWVWFSFQLFANYKIKIKEYLHHLMSHDQAYIHTAAGEEEEAGVDITAPSVQHPILAKAISNDAVLSREMLNLYISGYNPSIKTLIKEDFLSLSMLKRAYYHNENFFSRLLIIWYIRSESIKFRLSFVKEFYNISELQLKTEMMSVLNMDEFKPEESDVYFFTSLCEECVREIAWTEATIYDVAESVDQKLIDALLEHLRTQHNLLFELLKGLYENESIIAIQDVINSRDKSFENKIFAVELLDNILDNSMKKLIIPVFEDISFSAKKEKLQKIVLVYNLPCNDRLKEILMANFMTVSPYIKQLALEEYFRLTNDTSALVASSSSYLENVSATAGMLLHSVEEPLFMNKLKAIEAIQLKAHLSDALIAHFMKWGMFIKQKNGRPNKNLTKHAIQTNAEHIDSAAFAENGLSFDTLGLSLMLRMK